VSTNTRHVIEAYFLVPSAYQAALNAKFENYGLGPDNFSVGLSASGSAPAQAYHAHVALRLKDLAKIKYVADHAPKAWIWVRVLTKYLPAGGARELAALVEAFDLEPYQDLAWQSRDKAYIKISTAAIRPAAALAFLANQADPSVTLQVISAS